MAFGLSSCGTRRREQGSKPAYRTLEEYYESIRQLVAQGLVDIMLMSARTADQLARAEGLFEGSAVTPAVRMNDSTDIWLAGSKYDYRNTPSLPFSTTSISHAMHGHVAGLRQEEATVKGRIKLGLYSITLNHDAKLDRDSLEAYRCFRHEAEAAGFRHFLEVFPPNDPQKLERKDFGNFVADSIARLLAGVSQAEQPEFLKVPYLGERLTAELCAYDSRMIVGIMGGAAGTTHDAFHLLAESRKAGVRAALFGRKINQAEDQLLFVEHLRGVADGNLAAVEAVKSYHAALERAGVLPHRPLAMDLELTSACHGLDAEPPTLKSAQPSEPRVCEVEAVPGSTRL